MNKIPKRVLCSGDDCYSTVDTFGAVVREDGTLHPHSILCGDCHTKSKKHSLKKWKKKRRDRGEKIRTVNIFYEIE
jgi:hypothetical protein